MLTEGATLFKQAAMMMVHTRKVLGLKGAPARDEVLWWRPLLQRMEDLAGHRRMEASGVVALRSFAEIWDERVRQMAAVEERPGFSSAQIIAMAPSLACYETWLRAHFPTAFLPDGPSSN